MSDSNHNGTSSRFAPDIGTVLGLITAVVCIGGGLLLEGGKIADIRQVTAAIIVIGGTLGAVLITNPLSVCLAAMKRGANILFVPPNLFRETLDKMTELAERARRMGLASLETEAAKVDDPFLRKALGLAADGTDLKTLREMMTIDIDFELDRADEEEKVWESAGGYAPTVGIIGAVLGLIQVMKHLENLDEVGRGIAVAFVATVYGVFSANVIFLPIAGKLKARSNERSRLRELMVEGVISIAEGINPKLLRIKFESLVPQTQAEARRSLGRKPAAVPSTAARSAVPAAAKL